MGHERAHDKLIYSDSFVIKIVIAQMTMSSTVQAARAAYGRYFIEQNKSIISRLHVLHELIRAANNGMTMRKYKLILNIKS